MHLRPMPLRTGAVLFVAIGCAAGGAVAQTTPSAPPPRVDGNRANGLNYQPTQAEVGSREKAAGVVPPAAQHDANGAALENMDKTLLRQQGLSTKSVPNMTNAQ